MTERKKPIKTSKAKTKEEPGIAAMAHDAKPKLTKEELYRIELFYSRMELAKAKAELAEQKAREVEREAQLKARALRTDAEMHKREAVRQRDSGRAFMLSLGPKYGIDFSKATYDSEDGTITVIEEDEKVERKE